MMGHRSQARNVLTLEWKVVGGPLDLRETKKLFGGFFLPGGGQMRGSGLGVSINRVCDFILQVLVWWLEEGGINVQIEDIELSGISKSMFLITEHVVD